MSQDGLTDGGPAAALVTGYQSHADGVWLEVHVLGAEQEVSKKDLNKFFKGGRRKVHICYPNKESQCPIFHVPALHLTKFTWFPPGDFTATWLSAAAKKRVASGPALAKQAADGEHRRVREEEPEPNGISETEKRLAALRGDGRRVSFSPHTELGRTRDKGKGAGNLDGPRVGILRRRGDSPPARPDPPPLMDNVKREVIDLTEKKGPSKSPRTHRKKTTVGVALASAAAAQQRTEVKKEKRSRERSRSRKRRKNRKRKQRHSSSPDGSSDHSSSSSTSSSLLPPLKRRSQRQPGSVLKMLEQQAYDFLSQDGIVEGDEQPGEPGSRPKLFTYFQLGLRPSLDPKSRDAKELALLSKALDTLRDGKLDVLADMLAARLIAVDTATRQGWGTARHLEVYDGENDGTAPAHILLAAQKHGRQIERAGGKGSWSRLSWGSEWPLRSAGKPKRTGGLYPLPVRLPDHFSTEWQTKYATSCTDFAVKASVCASLNALYGMPGQGRERRPGKIHEAAFKLLEDKIQRFLEGETQVGLSFKDVVRDLKEKRTSYTGEEVILGDVHLLPHGTAWLPLTVAAGEELRVSQGDMSAAFCLFEIPSGWQQFMCSNFAALGEQIGRTAGQRWRPCCRVLPMCWNSSVGVMQMISREILLSKGVPSELELHKGKPVPAWFSGVVQQTTPTTAWWQIYLDNFMSAERSADHSSGLDADLQKSAMAAWHSTGVLTADDKQVIGSSNAIELGVRLDGERGLLGAAPERIFKTSLATLFVLQKQGLSQKDAQIVLGRWVFILQYRRAAMSILSKAWTALEGRWPTERQRSDLMRELEMILCLGPILQSDMRCEFDEQVTCSDASQTGGAAAASQGLTWSGQTLVRWPRAIEVHVYAGFPCVHLSRARAYRENLQGEGSNLFWRLVEVLEWIKEAFALQARVKYCIENVASMDDAARREISSVLDIQPLKLDPCDTLPYNRPRLAWCSEEFYSMEGLRLVPEKDYVRVTVLEGAVEDSQWMRPGWRRTLEGEGNNFATFMKSIPRVRPPPFPAGLDKCDEDTRQRWQSDSFRFPPYQYAKKYLLEHPSKGLRLLDSSEKELLLGFGPGHTASCRSASEAKANMTAFEDSRLSLCGDSFSIPSFALIGAMLCSELVPRMRPGQIIARLGLAPGASAHPDIQIPMTRWLAYSDFGDGDLQPLELVKSLGLQVNHTGSDVRVLTGEPLSKRGAHGSMRAWWWQWKQLFTVKWSEEAQPCLDNLDGIITDWIELQWTRGEPLTYIADALLQAIQLTKRRRILAEEQRKLAALESLNEAIASKDTAALEAAILEAQQADLDATEVDTAKSLLELELQKIALWQRLEKAQQQRVINELRDVLSAAMNLGFSLSELAAAQAVLKEEERKETAREALAEAIAHPDVATLDAALKEAAHSGLTEEEMINAQDALQLAQRLVETRNELESAVKTRDPARLMAAIEAGQSCGLERHELEPAEAVLKEAWVEQARKSLKRAINEQDVRALFRAVADSEAVGLEPEELDEAKRVLEEEAALATKDAEHRLEKRQLLLPAAELTFEVARPALDAEGYGGFDWKVRENIAFCTVAVGQELASALEKAWFTKKSNILDELCQNLRSCHMSSIGRLCKPEALDKHVLLKLGLDLQLECETSCENWTSSPIALAVMLFYTQQDVDTDRALLFPDCPSSMVAGQLFKERKEAYDAYRTRTSALGARNPMLFSEVSHVATAVLQSALRGLQQAPDVTTERPLQKWVKTACLLSSCRQKFEDSKSLTRILTNVSERGVQELRKKQKDDIMVCPQLLSTSSNPDYVQKYLSLGASSLEKHVVLTISNVTEWRHPKSEKEVLLPFLSVLRVQDISFEEGQPTRVRCQFQGSMLSPRLRSACLSDLTMASYELVQGLDDLPIPSPISVSLGESKTDRPNLRDHTQYNTKVFQTLVHAFEALDRRGAWMISYADYSWAQDTLASSVGVKRILRKLTGHFANSHLDLTLQKFFVLTMPGATDGQLERAFRWTSRYLRNTEPQRLEESPSASPQSPQTPVIRTTTPRHPRLRTWR
eukprot:s423_g11.t1